MTIDPTKNIVVHYNTTHLKTPVHESFVIELPEHPPDALHEPRVQRLVVILEVDPASETPNYGL